MLDDLKFIAKRDKSDAFGVAAKQAGQLNYSGYSLSGVPRNTPTRVVMGGMGGSALAGLICQRWWRSEIQTSFEVVRTYDLPAYVKENCLVIASSYSGNTEEEIAMLEDARQQGAEIVVMSSGGKLQEIAKENDYPHLLIPAGLQPRMAVLYSIRILAGLFDHVGLTKNAVNELEALSDWLAGEAALIEPTIGTSDNLAKQIAQYLVGKTGVIYSGPHLSPAAYKWKISLNESSKNLAWNNEFSEFNHNEILGWTSHPVEKVFGVIELMSSHDNPQIAKRFEVTNRLLSGQMPEPMIVEAKGESHIAQLLWTVQLGDFVSIYLAMLNNVDPTPVETIEKLKKQL